MDPMDPDPRQMTLKKYSKQGRTVRFARRGANKFLHMYHLKDILSKGEVVGI